MSLPTLMHPHGPATSAHNGATLAYLTRQQHVVTAAIALAHERRFFADDATVEPLTAAEQQLADALRNLGEGPA